MKLLVWHDKYGDHYVLARDAAEEARAWLTLFKMIKSAGYYNYELDGDDKEAYEGAVAGNPRDARWLLEMHSGCEYENITIEYPVVPE